MATPKEVRKDTQFKVLMENGEPLTRLIVGLLNAPKPDPDAKDKDRERYRLELNYHFTPDADKPNHIFTALFYAQREEDMLKGVTFPVRIEIARDPAGRYRPNRIVAENGSGPGPTPPVGNGDATGLDAAKEAIAAVTVVTRSEAGKPDFTTFGRGDKVSYRCGEGDSLPIPNSDKFISNGDYGVITDITDGVIAVCFEGMLGGTYVTVKPREIQLIEKAQPVAAKGTDEHTLEEYKDALKASQRGFATMHDLLRESEDRNTQLAAQVYHLIRLSQHDSDRAHQAEERAKSLESQLNEASEVTAPLPTTAQQFEIVIIVDVKQSHLDLAEAEDWEWLHMQFREDNGFNALVRRPKHSKGLPMREAADAAYQVKVAPVITTHTDIQETPVVILGTPTADPALNEADKLLEMGKDAYLAEKSEERKAVRLATTQDILGAFAGAPMPQYGVKFFPAVNNG